jgi:hypothetical protein
MIAELLQRITSALDHAEIPYMVSGSVALVTYTVPRMSRDIDIIIELRNKISADFANYSKKAIIWMNGRFKKRYRDMECLTSLILRQVTKLISWSKKIRYTVKQNLKDGYVKPFWVVKHG